MSCKDIGQKCVPAWVQKIIDGLLRFRPNSLHSEPVCYMNPDMEHQAEEAECAGMVLDDMGVPRSNGNGKTFSLVGRIRKAIEMQSHN